MDAGKGRGKGGAERAEWGKGRGGKRREGKGGREV